MDPDIDINQNKMQKKEVPVHWDQVKPLKVGNKTFRSVHDCHLTEEDLKRAHSELGETEILRNVRLKELKEKLQKNKNMRYRTDDQYLLRYLRYAKFDANKAFRVIEKFYNLRKDHPNEFGLSSKLEECLEAGIVTVLPYRDEQDSIMYYVNVANWTNTDEITLTDLFQVGSAISDIITMNPSSQVHSVTGSWDMSGFNMQHFRQFLSPSTALFLRRFMLETYPWRIKSFTAFNCNRLFRTVYNALAYIFKKKLADRVRLLGYDLDELHQHVNKALLPKAYGGNIDESELIGRKLVMQNMDYLKYERSFQDLI